MEKTRAELKHLLHAVGSPQTPKLQGLRCTIYFMYLKTQLTLHVGLHMVEGSGNTACALE